MNACIRILHSHYRLNDKKRRRKAASFTYTLTHCVSVSYHFQNYQWCVTVCQKARHNRYYLFIYVCIFIVINIHSNVTEMTSELLLVLLLLIFTIHVCIAAIFTNRIIYDMENYSHYLFRTDAYVCYESRYNECSTTILHLRMYAFVWAQTKAHLHCHCGMDFKWIPSYMG